MAPKKFSAAVKIATTPRHDYENLLNEHDTAARLCLKVSTLRRWRWAGTELTFIRVGGAVRYDPRDIEAFITAGRRQSTSGPGGSDR